MQLRILLKRLLLIISIAGIVFSLVVIVFNLFSQNFYTESASLVSSHILQDLINNKTIVSQNTSSEKTTSPGLPVRLKIPKINVDATFEYVGLTLDGIMDIMQSPDDVAWFELGPRPGEKGNAVIAGHYGRWKNGQGSVFDDLNKIRKGDKLYIEDSNGSTIIFVVSEFKIYDANGDASDVFSSKDEKAHLNLVTCSGIWNKDSENYSERLVVFADKE